MPRPFKDIGGRAVHLCVDMQRMFADDTPWRTPWMAKVLPNVRTLIRYKPDRVLFTRFIPARSPRHATGTWQAYYEKWPDMTLNAMPPEWAEIIPELRAESPQAAVFDKSVYSPWHDGQLDAHLRHRQIDTVIISGTETEVCVAAAVLGAIDRGYRVIVATDAICSSSDETHDAMVDIYHQRYSVHVSAATTDTILGHW